MTIDPYATMAPDDEIRVRIVKGDGDGNYRRGIGLRVILPTCRVDQATKKTLDIWLADMRKLDPKVTMGFLLDHMTGVMRLRERELVAEALRLKSVRKGKR